MGGKSSTTTSSVKIPQEVLDRYNSVNAQAQTAAANPFQQYGTQASDFVAQINPQQTAGISGVNASANLAQPAFEAAKDATTAGMGPADLGGLDIQKYLSPYLSQVAGTTAQLMGQQNEQAQSGALGSAASSGAFGGDRAGIAAANLSQQQNLAMGSTLANIQNQGYNTAAGIAQGQQSADLAARQANLARLLQGGSQMATLGAGQQAAGLQGAEAQINAGSLQQQTDQSGKTALINQFMQKQGYPFQIAQFLANIAEGTGALSGSTTSTTSPSSWWSDERLKHSVERIGATDDGQPLYTFKYRNDPDQRTHIGLMAQEVEQAHPDAVTTDPASGYKAVNLDRALGAAKAEGGSVSTPYNSGLGAAPGGSSYVPEAYLPVGQLMMADPAAAQSQQQTLADQIDSASKFGDNLGHLKDDWGSLKEILKGAPKAMGGALGDVTADDKKDTSNPVGYMQPALEAQAKADKPQLPSSAPQQGGQQGGLGGLLSGIGSAASGVASILPFFLKDGGRVGYADGGMPGDYPGETTEDLIKRRQREADDIHGATPGIAGALGSALGSFAGRAAGEASLPSSQDAPLRPWNQGAPGHPDVPPTAGLGAASPSAAPVPAPNEPGASPMPWEGEVAMRDRYMADRQPPASLGDAAVPASNDMAVLHPRPGQSMAYSASAPTAIGSIGRMLKENFLTAPHPVTEDTPSSAPVAGLGDAMNATAQPSTSSIASSPVPPPRPEGLGTASVAPPPASPVAAASLQSSAMVDTGKIPSGGYSAVIPVETQAAFVMHELPSKNGMPSYLNTRYATAGDAAAAFDRGYERSAGTATAERATYANDVYAAYRNGDMSNLPPNAQKAFDYYVKNGMDAVHAAGAVGNHMVEAYSHVDPNAYNSKEGAFGISQWRGDRLNDLASFAGVDPSVFGSLPASTPEGRYYSTGAHTTRGLGTATAAGEPDGAAPRGGLGDAIGGLLGNKEYADRNALGRALYDPKTNKLNDNILSILSGIGAMASSPSRYLGASILQGIGGAAGAYQGLQEQHANIGLTNAQARAQQIVGTGMSGGPAIDLGGGETKPLLAEIGQAPAIPGGVIPTADQSLSEATTTLAGNAKAQAIIASPPVAQAIQQMDGPAVSPSSPVAAQGQENFKAAQDGYSSATRGFAPSMASFGAVSNLLSKGGAGSAGAFADQRAAAVAALNMAASVLGMPPVSDLTTDQQIIDKATSMAAAAETAGNPSVEALLNSLRSKPGSALQPQALASIQAQTLTDRQRALDRGSFYNAYGKGQGYKSQTGGQTYIGAEKAFNDAVGGNYNTEKGYLERIMLAPGAAENPDQARLREKLANMASGTATYTPDQVQSAIKWVYPDAPPEMWRYFFNKGLTE